MKTTTHELSPKAHALIRQAIVEDGLSYADAIKRLEQQAYSASRPYLQAAHEIRRWLDDLGGSA